MMEAIRLEQADYNKEALVLEQVTTAFDRGKTYLIFSDARLELGLLTAVMTGLESLNSGKLFYYGEEYSKNVHTTLRTAAIGAVFQKYNYIPELSAEENLYYYLQISNKPKKRAECLKYLASFGINGVTAKRPLQLLDIFTQKKYCLAKAVVFSPKLLVLDHLLSTLDFYSQEQIMAYLDKLAKEEQTCVILLEREQFLGRYTDEVWGLNRGKLSFIKSI
ncbi:ATP-binding cassette domain-containing protein [uncultured Enterococcus sp.]|uniref:ATP-binding cassette domain-containing protein n=1 Tax=uncultured Enterococcus sp. TaxID=167972 RepID=UPI002AA62EA4|nr:ATP-binding cassette domain-containing protein [uncultured Enterococcus sp.]